MIKQSWIKRKQLLENDFAITGWALCILPEIWDGVRLNLDGDKRMANERVISKLHVTPSSKVSSNDVDMTIGIFWKNLDIFRINQ